MRAAVYARVSTEEQAKEGTSIDNQLEKLRHLAQGFNWDIVAEYVDPGYSGKHGERPDLKRLMADARVGKFEIVAVSMIDRFFRNYRLLLEYVDALDKLKIAFAAPTENVNTRDGKGTGKLFLYLLGMIAEWERERIIERTKEGRQRRYLEGKWGPGKPLYGYQYDAVTKKLGTNGDEAAIVRRMFSLYVYDRLGLHQIARLLNKDGVSPRRASHWHKTVVRGIIVHPAYKGEHPLGVQCPAIVEPALWGLAQKRMKDNTRLHRRRDAPWLLQGLIKCGLCGRGLKAEWSHSKRIYQCHGRRQEAFPAPICGLPRIPAEQLEEQVWQRVTEALSDPESMFRAINDYIDRLKAQSEALEVTIKPVDERLTAVKAQLSKLAQDWVLSDVGDIDPDWVATRRKELEEEKGRLLAIRAEIDPAQIEELEETKYWLEFWGGTRKDLDRRLSFILEGETAEEVSVQQAEERELISSQFQGVVQFATIGDEELSRQLGVATTKRQLLDRLQTELWAYPDRVEIKAVVPIESLPQELVSAPRTRQRPTVSRPQP